MREISTRKLLLHAIFSFSVACLLVSPSWLISYSLGMPTDPKFLGNFYHYNRIFDHIEFLSIALLVVCLSAVLFCISIISESRQYYKWILNIVCIFAWLFLMDGIRRVYVQQLSFSNFLNFIHLHYFIAASIAVCITTFIVLYFLHILTVLRVSTFLIFPAALVFFVNNMYAVWLLSGDQYGYVTYDRSLAPIKAGEGSVPKFRVVTIMFDDWDHALTFENRDPSVEMPNVDALKLTVFQALNAQRFGGSTILAVPIFLTGMDIEETEASLRGDLLVTFRNGRQQFFSQSRTIFDVARESGLTTGYGGIAYHPYCVLFNHTVSKCSGGGYEENRAVRNIFSQILYVLKRIIPAGSRIFGLSTRAQKYGPSVRARSHDNGEVQNFLDSKDAMLKVSTDPTLGFVFAHLLIPHPPYIYDREANQFTPSSDDEWESKRYLDNLELLDRTIGEIESSLKKADLWDKTHLVLLSDHPSVYATGFTDPSDNRIPLLIKLAGQTEGVAYQPKFDAVRLFDLFPQLFAGKIKTTNDLVNYFNSIR